MMFSCYYMRPPEEPPLPQSPVLAGATVRQMAGLRAGITIGCRQRPLRYGPTTPVARAQSATLLRRGMGEHRREEAPAQSPGPPRGWWYLHA